MTAGATTATTFTADKVYYLSTTVATSADGVTAAATAISDAAAWTDVAGTAYVVIKDDDSAALYKWVDTATADEAIASELTLIGTIGVTLGSADITFAAV